MTLWVVEVEVDDGFYLTSEFEFDTDDKDVVLSEIGHNAWGVITIDWGIGDKSGLSEVFDVQNFRSVYVEKA